jgi:hypothetical protein
LFFWEKEWTPQKRQKETHTKNWVAVKKLIIEKQNEVPKQILGRGGGGGGRGGTFVYT